MVNLVGLVQGLVVGHAQMRVQRVLLVELLVAELALEGGLFSALVRQVAVQVPFVLVILAATGAEKPPLRLYHEMSATYNKNDVSNGARKGLGECLTLFALKAHQLVA